MELSGILGLLLYTDQQPRDERGRWAKKPAPIWIGVHNEGGDLILDEDVYCEPGMRFEVAWKANGTFVLAKSGEPPKELPR